MENVASGHKFAGPTTAGYKAAQTLHAKLKAADSDARTQVSTALGLENSDHISHFVEKFPTEHDANGGSIHDAAAASNKGTDAKANKDTPWGWITASTAIGGATVGLVVWAIMHNHDKKMLAKLNQANSQA